MEGVAVSKLDNDAFVISKRENEVHSTLNEEDMPKLENIFKSLQPWNKRYVLKRRVFIEVTGIPLHVFTHENIKRIGEQWGEVAEVSYIHNSFESVALTVSIVANKVVRTEMKVSVGDEVYMVLVRELCSCEFKEKYERQQVYLEESSMGIRLVQRQLHGISTPMKHRGSSSNERRSEQYDEETEEEGGGYVPQILQTEYRMAYRDDATQNQGNSDDETSHVPNTMETVATPHNTNEMAWFQEKNEVNKDFTAFRTADLEAELVGFSKEKRGEAAQKKNNQPRRGRPKKKKQSGMTNVNNVSLDPLGRSRNPRNADEQVEEGEMEEARSTWKVGRLVLMHSSNDDGVINALRKSQRRNQA